MDDWILALQCESGLVYMPCGSPCEQTCENIGDEQEAYCSAAHCVEGCFCPDGYIRNGERVTQVAR